MNQITLKDPKINAGLSTSFFTPTNKEATENMIDEVLIAEQYKLGRIKKDMVIVDCGANIGMASLYFKDWAKVIYAIEPSSKNFECLVENTKQYSNIKPLHYGLAARTGKEWIKTNGDTNIPESLFGDGNIKEEILVKGFDDFMKEQNIEHIDLLKIDVEGSEYLIFPSYGFDKSASKIDYIIGEAHYFGKLLPDYIPYLLNDAGFDMKFLPITNMFLTMDFVDAIERHYKIKKQTLFFAKRRDLPWPQN